MDFLQFLKSNQSNDNDKYASTQVSLNVKSAQQQQQQQEDTISDFVQYKKGDFIFIIYLENSPLNCYKGYIGEIKTYTIGSDNANVTLEALNSTTTIKFPIKHFKIRNVYEKTLHLVSL